MLIPTVLIKKQL